MKAFIKISFIVFVYMLSSIFFLYSSLFAQDDHGNTPQSASIISFSTSSNDFPQAYSLNGELEAEDDVDYFKFNAISGYTYVIETSELSYNCDTIIDLYDIDGTTLIETDDNGGIELASRIRWVANSSADYYIAIKPSSMENIGSYKITISADLTKSDDHSDVLEFATLIQPDGTLYSGNIEIAGDIDYFSFYVPLVDEPGNIYTIATSDLTDGCDTYIYLIRDYPTLGRRVIAENDNSTTGLESIIIERPAPNAYYYIAVRHSSSSGTGTYKISVSERPVREPTPPPPTPPPNKAGICEPCSSDFDCESGNCGTAEDNPKKRLCGPSGSTYWLCSTGGGGDGGGGGGSGGGCFINSTASEYLIMEKPIFFFELNNVNKLGQPQ